MVKKVLKSKITKGVAIVALVAGVIGGCYYYYDYSVGYLPDFTISSESYMEKKTDKKTEEEVCKDMYDQIKNDLADVKGIESMEEYVQITDEEVVGIVDTSTLYDTELEARKFNFTTDACTGKKTDMIFKKIFVDDKLYKEIINDLGLDETKYVGVENPDAIIYNRGEGVVNAFESEEWDEWKVFNTNIDTISIADKDKLDEMVKEEGGQFGWTYADGFSMEDNDGFVGVGKDKFFVEIITENMESMVKKPFVTKEIKVGGIVNKKIEEIDGLGIGFVGLLYPKSLLKEYSSYSIEIYAEDYFGVKDQLDKIAKKYNLNQFQYYSTYDRQGFSSLETMLLFFVVGGLVILLVVVHSKNKAKKDIKKEALETVINE